MIISRPQLPANPEFQAFPIFRWPNEAEATGLAYLCLMAVELYQTKDQSHTLYVPELDETYHSRNGAVEEAMYVYIGKGLRDSVAREESAVSGRQSAVETSGVENINFVREGSTVDGPQSIVEMPDVESISAGREGSAVKKPDKEDTLREFEKLPVDNFILRQQTADRGLRAADNPLAVLEIGFGTGLNAWLTAIECASLNIRCIYHSLETFPLGTELIGQLNYCDQAAAENRQLFTSLHSCNWNEAIVISDFFELTKFEIPLQSFVAARKYDVIYFDAFAPDKQPELWTRDVFQRLYDCLNPGGVIVTYSSKGSIKRTWKEIGFEVERLPGPPMKRHMLRGRRNL